MDDNKIITVEQAHDMIGTGDVIVVDIRDAASFEGAHIKDAVNVSDVNIQEFVASADKSKPLICYCYHGFSSQQAAGYFQSAGFEKVYSMEGGFEQWRQVFPEES